MPESTVSPQSVTKFPFATGTAGKTSVDTLSFEEERPDEATTIASSSASPKQPTVLGLLDTRQQHNGGNRISSGPSSSVILPWSPAHRLASAVAWNPSRMHNMILVVGPGTPASVCWRAQGEEDEEEEGWSVTSQDILLQADSDGDEEEEEEKADDDDDDLDHYHSLNEERMETASEGGEAQAMEGTHDDNEEGNDSSSSDDDDSGDETMEHEPEQQEARHRRTIRSHGLFQFLRRRVLDAEESSEGDSDIVLPAHHHRYRLPQHRRHEQRPSSWLPSMRHGGCINTACWLDVPWRVSSSGSVPLAVESNECPTQLMTSGDDRLIKIWDVSNAIGMASPLSGGWDTFAPLLNHNDPSSPIGSASVHRSWKQQYNHCDKNGITRVPGSVHLLATLTSGHRGNVFHVTPVDAAPGKILSCGADGYLRLSDLESETSTVVVSPFLSSDDSNDSDDDYYGGFHGGMAYSHQMLTAQTGLLCSERGLHHFDLRLSPREQGHQSLLQSSKRRGYARSVACKACAVWKPQNSLSSPSSGAEIAPTLVFAGGSSEIVELLDLRMEGSTKKVLQRYRPRDLDDSSNVSVSGLDLSKDGRELLVSYESDQIYSFPVFPDCASSAGPTLDDISAASTRFSEDAEAFLPEMASYGGHLNRFTFLKNAKYAGPNDDYIITGSDSGNAWIYERKTGTVVSLLSSDSSTCNGVIAHPSLPLFITYGIDSTAKLWRAAPCVKPNSNDSPTKRAQASLQLPYEMSPVARSWDGVQALVRKIDDVPSSMPDFVASSEEIAGSGRFSSQVSRGICGEDSPSIGNSLRNLPMILRVNRYECYRAAQESRSVPVEQPLSQFSHRVSMSRLRLQADRLGLKWNPVVPWVFEGYKREEIHPADLVPDNPSDWILFDKQMTEFPLDIQMNFNLKDYESILQRTFPDNAAFFDMPQSDVMNTIPWLTEEQQSVEAVNDALPRELKMDEGEACEQSSKFKLKSRKLLYETAALLKEGGNQAVKKGLLHVAARRYDKAIQYCAVAFMHYPEGHTKLKHLTEGHHADLAELGRTLQGRPTTTVVVWSPLLQILITSRLNLSLLLAKPEFAQPGRASDQARAALKLLFPFARKEGKVYLGTARGEKKDCIVNDHEPSETFKEAKGLQAKAYFRLGSAELDMGDYSAAIKSFELALKSSTKVSPNKTADSLLTRRLQEAKRKRQLKKKRDRKKFQRLMNGGEPDESNAVDPSGNPT